MEKFFVLIACFIFCFAFVQMVQANDESEDDENNAKQFLHKRFLGIPFAREQRREAKERYEERCERALGINKVTGLQRWCPKLEEWDQWRQAAGGDRRFRG